MTKRSGQPLPAQPPEAGGPAAEPGLNPFAGNHPVEQQPSRLGLGGGGILDHAGVLLPADAENRQDGESNTDAKEAAKKACGMIAEMFIKNGDPDSLRFPPCADMSAVSESLGQLANTPLGLGYGRFPSAVWRAWSRFTRETTDNYRMQNGLEVADLVPLRVEIPAWLRENPTFDILHGCTLMDIEVVGAANSVIAQEASYCRITFKNDAHRGANIGQRASRCSFVFEGNMYADESFKDAVNTSVHIYGNHDGRMGPMEESKVVCDGEWRGAFYYKGVDSARSSNVEWFPWH